MTEFKSIVRKKVTMGDGKHKLSLAAANLLTHGVKGAKGDVRSAGLFLSKTEKLGLFNEPDADANDLVENVDPNPIPQTPVDYLLENLEVDRLSRAEQIELSYLCETIDKGGHVTVLSTGEFDRFKYLICKGRCTDVTPAH
jgi:hypothetical protein